MNIMLGWRQGSWGYHGDDGSAFNSGQNADTGDPFGEKYDEGDVIGCGVNFNEETAFYTKNEKIIGTFRSVPVQNRMLNEIIGRAFRNVRGKLYPAISVETGMAGCTMSVKFWDYELNGNPDFLFKGILPHSRIPREPTRRVDRMPTEILTAAQRVEILQALLEMK